jgi:hypothetical protein
MEYKREILENGDHSIVVWEEGKTIGFIARPTSDLPEHPLMIASFEANEANVEAFARLLWANPNTAFTEFVSTLV